MKVFSFAATLFATVAVALNDTPIWDGVTLKDAARAAIQKQTFTTAWTFTGNSPVSATWDAEF